MLRLTATYTLYIFRKLSPKYTKIHASKKEINEKNIKVFLGGVELPHTLHDVLYGGTWRKSVGKSGQ